MMLRAALISIVLITLVQNASSQLLHYIYFQSEGKIPFAISHQGRRHVSTSTGYVLLSRLESRVHSCELRLLSDSGKAFLFDLRVEKEDLGFFLKRLESNEWVLVNMLTLEVVRPAGSEKAREQAPQSDDSFANILAEVVGTPSLREIPLKESIVLRDTLKSVDYSGIRLLGTSLENNIRSSRYLLMEGQSADTVMMSLEYVPLVSKGVFAEEKSDGSVERIARRKESLAIKDTAAVQVSRVEVNTIVTDTVVAPPSGVRMQEERPSILRYCSSSATQDDFFKLRKKMAGVNSDKAMMQAARRFFGSRCFTSEQLRNLSVLFLSEQGKFDFLEMAYASVFDRDKFPELVSLFSDPEFIKRFRALQEKMN